MVRSESPYEPDRVCNIFNMEYLLEHLLEYGIRKSGYASGLSRRREEARVKPEVSLTSLT